MHWIVWLLLAWIVLSVAIAVVFGRVIRVRDEREVPRPLEEDDEGMRDAG